MITDCHAHFREPPLGRGAQPSPRQGLTIEPLGRTPEADMAEYCRTAGPADATLVLGFVSRRLDVAVPNEELADFVAAQPGRLFGFAGIDPADPFALTEIDRACDFGLRGLTLSPAAQGVHPADERAMEVYQRACERNLPVIFHQGEHFAPQWKMEFARPYLLDEVARTFPDLRIVVSHLGRPWVDETVMLLDKHPNVFADVCGLAGRAWQAYQALSICSGAGVMHKLLLGSDWPNSSVEQTIKGLYTVNELTQGTNLPAIPLRELRGVVESDALFMLGLSDHPAEPAAVGAAPMAGGDFEPDSTDEGEAVMM